MHEIWRNGYEASSVKALSEKLGITRSSFYNAFGSREALFRQAFAAYCEQSPDIALTRARQGALVLPLLANTFKAACAVRAGDRERRGCMAVNSVVELCNVHAELGPVLEEAILGSLARIEQLLEWAVEQGEIEAGRDLHALALALQTLLMGLNVICKVVSDEEELWQIARTTLRGLGLIKDDDDPG